MDYTLTLPGGETLDGMEPTVVIGPNGSGKTRQTRQIQCVVPIEFINALRNTRVAPELPAVGVDTARNNYVSQKNSTRVNHWELAGEFDYMLSQMLAQQSMAAIEFTRRYQADPENPGHPEETPLSRVETLWGQVFPGRELHWRDWKPLIRNRSTGTEVEYSGNQMSDGEKAALYLAGRVFSAEAGVLVVDEPETHFHSLLAVRLWDALEAARPDVRFVYVTHDLTFALSRREPRFVLASPTDGLRTVDLQAELPPDVTEALLGSASLSFYASRVIFCEGDTTSRDSQLYACWFSGADTVLRPVHDCQRVMRCVDAVGHSGIANALTAVGIIDGDYHPEAFRAALPAGVTMLEVHEVESLFCLPAVVAAVCTHLGQTLDEATYRSALANTVSADQRHQLIIERWKRRIEPHLQGLVSGVSARKSSVAELIADLPQVFDHTAWDFSPQGFLEEERTRVEAAIPSGPLTEILRIVPGKQLLPVAARHTGLAIDAYVKLICDALRPPAGDLAALGTALEAALSPYLPPRQVSPARGPVEPLSLDVKGLVVRSRATQPPAVGLFAP
jgi:energy-coupling factor transporter ATP-binding protein EcfA2